MVTIPRVNEKLLAPKQAKREKRQRDKEAGTAFTPEEAEDYSTAISTCYRPRSGPPLAKRRRRLLQDKTAHKASLDWIRSVDNALRQSIRRRLHSFRVDFDRLDKLLASGELTLAPLRDIAPTLAGVYDQAPWQVCASYFLRYELEVNLVPLWDPGAHRIHNDWKGAISDSKLKSTVYRATTLFNLVSGPTQSKGKWRKVSNRFNRESCEAAVSVFWRTAASRNSR